METFFFHFRLVVVVELKMGHGKCVLMYLGEKIKSVSRRVSPQVSVRFALCVNDIYCKINVL